jgi:hypothetical protein
VFTKFTQFTVYKVSWKKAKNKKGSEEIKPLRNVGIKQKEHNVGTHFAVNYCHKTTVVKRVRYKKRQLGAPYSAFVKSPIVVLTDYLITDAERYLK